jgi:hypothetical protein
MPLLLHLTPAGAPGRPTGAAFRRLHAMADFVYPELRSLWAVVFADLAESLPLATLDTALRSHSLLAVETALAPAFARLEGEARAVLPLLLRQAVQQAQAAVGPLLQRALGVELSVQFGVVNEASLQWIAEYAGAQIRDVSATTRQAVREALERQFTAGRSVTQVMADLTAHVGLAPRQTLALERLRAKLLADGLPAGTVARTLDVAARRAVQLRTEVLARTEALTASMAGQDQLWRTAADQGLLDRERFRRFWFVTSGDERLCPTCRAIPGLNPQGVRLDEPFATPVGPVMFPPAHPLCRCAVNGRVLPG